MVVLAVIEVAWYVINPTGHRQDSFHVTTATKCMDRNSFGCGVVP